MLESVLSRTVSIEKHFVIDRFMYSGNRKLTSLQIIRPNLIFLMSQAIQIVIFDFSKVSYTRNYCFKDTFSWELFCYGSIYVRWLQEVILTSNFSANLAFFDVVTSSAYHIRLPQGFLCQNLFFPKLFQLGNILLWTDLCAVAIGG